jgi:hypothetical protein
MMIWKQNKAPVSQYKQIQPSLLCGTEKASAKWTLPIATSEDIVTMAWMG